MTNNQAELRLISKTEAAKLLGIGKNKLNLLIEEGKIRFIAFDERIRIPLREINRFIDENLTDLKSTKERKKIILDTSFEKQNNNFNSPEFFNQLMKGV